MSWFGDGTPAQDILDWVKGEASNHDLSDKQVIKILAEIIAYYSMESEGKV